MLGGQYRDEEKEEAFSQMTDDMPSTQSSTKKLLVNSHIVCIASRTTNVVEEDEWLLLPYHIYCVVAVNSFPTVSFRGVVCPARLTGVSIASTRACDPVTHFRARFSPEEYLLTCVCRGTAVPSEGLPCCCLMTFSQRP